MICWAKPKESTIWSNPEFNKVINPKKSQQEKVVNSVTSVEKGKTMTIVSCSNKIGNFLPPALIIKGVNKNLNLRIDFQWAKKSDINTELFYK